MSGHQRLVRNERGGQRRLAGLAAETTGAVRLARTGRRRRPVLIEKCTRSLSACRSSVRRFMFSDAEHMYKRRNDGGVNPHTSAVDCALSNKCRDYCV